MKDARRTPFGRRTRSGYAPSAATTGVSERAMFHGTVGHQTRPRRACDLGTNATTVPQVFQQNCYPASYVFWRACLTKNPSPGDFFEPRQRRFVQSSRVRFHGTTKGPSVAHSALDLLGGQGETQSSGRWALHADPRSSSSLSLCSSRSFRMSCPYGQSILFLFLTSSNMQYLPNPC